MGTTLEIIKQLHINLKSTDSLMSFARKVEESLAATSDPKVSR